jgi:hypothetical protein
MLLAIPVQKIQVAQEFDIVRDREHWALTLNRHSREKIPQGSSARPRREVLPFGHRPP